MSEQKYPSNSDKSRINPATKPEREKKESVVSTPATIKNKSFFLKLIDPFVNTGSFSAKEDIVDRILIPALKRTIGEAIHSTTDILFGARRGDYHGDPRSSSSRYDRYYTVRDSRFESSSPAPRRSRIDCYNIVVNTYSDAMNVIDSMRATVRDFGIASVGDLKEFANITPDTTDYNLGWSNFDSAVAVAEPDGRYWIRVPKPMRID